MCKLLFYRKIPKLAGCSERRRFTAVQTSSEGFVAAPKGELPGTFSLLLQGRRGRSGRRRFHSCSRRRSDWCFLICISISLNAFLHPARTFLPFPVARSVPVGSESVRARDCSSVR